MPVRKFMDRRIFQRFPVNLTFQYAVANAHKKNGEAQTFDISANGVGFTSKCGFRTNAQLALLLTIPNEANPFYLRGNVVWSKIYGFRKYRTGIQIENTDLIGVAKLLQEDGRLKDLPYNPSRESFLRAMLRKILFIRKK